MAGGANFKNAYLGHMASETVVSHNVMTSGMLPKNMGWADEWYRDVDGVLGTPGDMYVSGSMTQPQFDTLVQQGLPEARGLPEGEVPGQGRRRGRPEELRGVRDERPVDRHPGHLRRPQLRLRRRRDVDNTWRGPVGVNVPTYITEPTVAPACPAEDHFYVDANTDLNYGTLTTSPAWMYPLQGNRDISGNDPTTRVVTSGRPMRRSGHGQRGLERDAPDLGGIDKAGHMWGGLNDVPPYPAGAEDPLSHMANAAKVADEQVGRVIAKLKDRRPARRDARRADHRPRAADQRDNYYGLDGVNVAATSTGTTAPTPTRPTSRLSRRSRS